MHAALRAYLELTPASDSMVRMQGSISDALEGLLNLEKVQRLAENSRATKLCCTAILEICFGAKDWKLLNEHIILLAKRRSQLKQVGT